MDMDMDMGMQEVSVRALSSSRNCDRCVAGRISSFLKVWHSTSSSESICVSQNVLVPARAPSVWTCRECAPTSSANDKQQGGARGCDANGPSWRDPVAIRVEGRANRVVRTPDVKVVGSVGSHCSVDGGDASGCTVGEADGHL